MRHTCIVVICKRILQSIPLQSVHYYQTINHINQTTRAVRIQTMIVYLQQECLIIQASNQSDHQYKHQIDHFKYQIEVII